MFRRKFLLAGSFLLTVVALLVVGRVAYSEGFWFSHGDQRGLVLPGTIEAHESTLSFKVIQSPLVYLPLQEGAWVTEGTVIARVDDRDYHQEVVIAQAAVQQARSTLDAAKYDLAAASQNEYSTKAELAQKELDYRRIESLYSEHVASQSMSDQAATAVSEARAASLRNAAINESAERKVRASEAALRLAEENLKLASINLDYTTLRAPFAGVIEVREAELGEMMAPGVPVVTMADLDHPWLKAYVSETDLSKIRWGQDVIVSTDSQPGKKYHGRISFISSKAEFTPKSVETHEERVTLVYRIKIDLDNPQHELKPGMPADAHIAAAS